MPKSAPRKRFRAWSAPSSPFARTKAEREKTGDPRPSIEERYASREDFLAQVDAATRPLIAKHLLLERDAERIKEKAAARWDSLMTVAAK